ncbi:MAG: GatB/YqeY domain-containing protein [Bacteroidales bacterium]|nr:GatB/YqeY domain-containing protein [Bacteroidales bacterium]
MKISEQINNDLKDAMRNKDKIALEALRAAKTAFTLTRTQTGSSHVVSDADELKIIQKLVKQRKESAEIYKSQSRTDLSDKEIAEAEVLEKYLPEKISPKELKRILEKIIEKAGASSPADMGKVMGIATKELAGKADGKEIAAIVRSILTG